MGVVEAIVGIAVSLLSGGGLGAIIMKLISDRRQGRQDNQSKDEFVWQQFKEHLDRLETRIATMEEENSLLRDRVTQLEQENTKLRGQVVEYKKIVNELTVDRQP